MSTIEWLDIFGNNLKEIMDEKGYSQNDLSEATGISQSSISKYINGQQIPNAITIVNLSYTLDCDIYELIDFGDMVD